MLSTKRTRVPLGTAATVAAISLGAGPGFAQETGQMTVTASLTQECSLGTIDDLDFGEYDPDSVAEAEATFTVGCKVDSDGGVTVKFDDGGNVGSLGPRRLSTTIPGTSAGGSLKYELYTDSARTNVWTGPITKRVDAGENTFTVYGEIPGDASDRLVEGIYTDTVTVTLTFGEG